MPKKQTKTAAHRQRERLVLLLRDWQRRASQCTKTQKLYDATDRVTARHVEAAAEVYRTCRRELITVMQQENYMVTPIGRTNGQRLELTQAHCLRSALSRHEGALFRVDPAARAAPHS